MFGFPWQASWKPLVAQTASPQRNRSSLGLMLDLFHRPMLSLLICFIAFCSYFRGHKAAQEKKQVPGNGGSQELFGPMFPWFCLFSLSFQWEEGQKFPGTLFLGTFFSYFRWFFSLKYFRAWWESAKVSHKRVFALLTPEIRSEKMTHMLQKPVFALPGCQRMSVNTLLCDTLALADLRGCQLAIIGLLGLRIARDPRDSKRQRFEISKLSVLRPSLKCVTNSGRLVAISRWSRPISRY